MALIDYGDFVAGASGSIGGTTYSHNRYGAYARQRSVPVNPNTSRQSYVRNLMATLTQYWNNTLTSTQRSQWANYAANVSVLNRLGKAVYLTGLNHFVRSNIALLQAGFPQVDAGPVILTLPETDPTMSATMSEATQQLSIAFDDGLDWVDEDEAGLLIHVGKPVNQSINFFGSPFRFADAIEGDSGTPPTTPAAIASPWVVQEDQKVFVQARIVRADGRLSNFFRTDCVCAS